MTTKERAASVVDDWLSHHTMVTRLSAMSRAYLANEIELAIAAAIEEDRTRIITGIRDLPICQECRAEAIGVVRGES